MDISHFLLINPRLTQVSFGMGDKNLYHHPVRGTYTLDDLFEFSKTEYFTDTSIPYGLAHNSPDYNNLSDLSLARRSLTAALKRKFEHGNGGTWLLVTCNHADGRIGGYKHLRERELLDEDYSLCLVDDKVSVHFNKET